MLDALDAGCWMLDALDALDALDTGCWMLWMLWILDAGCWMLDALDTGCWLLGAGVDLVDLAIVDMVDVGYGNSDYLYQALYFT